MPAPSSSIAIRDVTPRDGLQGEQPVDPAARVALVEALVAAGLTDVEVVSFVSPKAVPAMAGAAEVVDRLGRREGVEWWALVPNRRGAELARAAGIDHITVTVSASDAYSQRNVGCSAADALGALPDLLAAAAGAQVDVVVSCAFGSPYEDVTLRSVHEMVDAIRALGPVAVTLADTTGAATPTRIAAVLEVTGTDVGLHLHDTRGTALANALFAIDHGITRFDTAVGGLGGSPFAPGAGGNLATEDLVLVLADAGVDIGIDVAALVAVAATLAPLVGHPLPGRTAAAGPLPAFPAG
jgi:hydroxymethylglutaryl-CoA lyase